MSLLAPWVSWLDPMSTACPCGFVSILCGPRNIADFTFPSIQAQTSHPQRKNSLAFLSTTPKKVPDKRDVCFPIFPSSHIPSFKTRPPSEAHRRTATGARAGRPRCAAAAAERPQPGLARGGVRGDGESMASPKAHFGVHRYYGPKWGPK